MSPPRILFIAGDFPFHFYALTRALAEAMRHRGHPVAFVLTNRYYERFKGIAFDDLGPVHYIEDFRVAHANDPRLGDEPFDYWAAHATFVRTRAYLGHHPNRWEDYEVLALFYRDLFATYDDIGLVWSEPPSNATLAIAEQEARRADVPYLGYIVARIPGHFNVALDALATTYLDNPTAPTRAPEGPPDYMKTSVNRLGERSYLDVLRGYAQQLEAVRPFARRERSIELGDPLQYQLRAAARSFARKLRWARVQRSDVFAPVREPDPSQVNVLFPLQYRPEASSSMAARFHEDDLQTLHNIAFSLPGRGGLFVKEHPSAIGVRDLSFYRELQALPHVRLLHPSYPLVDNLTRFTAVVCLASTVGFEAIQRGIPTLLLGRVFYEDYPGVTRIASFEELDATLKTLTPAAPTAHAARPDVMARYLQSCFEGSVDILNEASLRPDNIDRLVAPMELVLAGESR